MADKKISEFDEATSLNSEDLFAAVTDPNGSPVNKKITVKNLFGAVSANTTIDGLFSLTANASFTGANTSFSGNITASGSLNVIPNLHVPSNRITIGDSKTPSTNNPTTEFGSPLSDRPHTGSIFWDNDYLYIAISNTVIKRVALSSF